MATGYMNTVPLGREGTGAAQILGPNRALQYALQQNQERQRRLDRAQEQYNQNQQGYANAFQRSMMETMNTVGGTRYVNPNIRNAIASATNEWARQGGQLMSQGINPFNPYQSEDSRDVSQQHNQSRAEIQSVLAINNQLLKEKDEVTKRITDKPQDYDVDEFKAFEQWYNDLTPEDIMAGNITPPTVSKIYDIGREAGKQFGAIYEDYREYDVDEQGNRIQREGRRADAARILNIADQSIDNPNSPYHRETNRRLRKELGPEASIEMFSPFLGISDKAEMESLVDAQLRNDTSEDNPLVDMLADGKAVQYGTDGYNQTVSEISDELLRANNIVSGAKQEVVDALTGRTNTSEKVKLDYTEENQRMKRQAAASLERSRALSRQNTALSIQKKVSGDDPVAEAMSEEAQDIDFSTKRSDGTVATPGITVPGVMDVSSNTIQLNTREAYSVENGAKVQEPEGPGRITGINPVGIDKNGNIVSGNMESLRNNPAVVKWDVKAVVQRPVPGVSGVTTSHIYDISSLPISTLTSTYKGPIEKAISIQRKTIKELNEEIKNRGEQKNSTQKTPAELMREAAGL